MAPNPVMFTPATDDQRPQIVEAVNLICNRHREGKLTTSIVIPPRVGKSNVIRLSALELVQSHSACTALALVPWDNLADQLTHKDKLQEMLRLYHLTPKAVDGFKAARTDHLSMTFHEVSYMHHLWVATIQLANSQIGQLDHWFDRCNASGIRPIVFIDECQMTSTTMLANRQTWGELALLGQRKGAHVVLLTGTPFRADGATIPGFKVRTMNEEEIERIVSRRINDQQILRRTFEGMEGERVLVADFEMTLRKAWRLNCLCGVSTKWVDVSLTLDKKKDKVTLASLEPSVARKHLRKAVTDPIAMYEMLEEGLSDMAARRSAGFRESAMLVVTCSDLNELGEESDAGTANWHARQVRNIIAEINPDLKTVIATQADEEGGNSSRGLTRLKHFVVDGIGDVLVVKAMGTVGMDCARIKTVVVLGTARQLAGWIQTILRGATTWGNIAWFTLVLTDDVFNRRNHEFIVKGGGGERTANLTFVREDIINLEKKIVDDPEVTIVGAECRNASDTNGGQTSDIENVEKVLAKFPELLQIYSHVQIAEMINNGHINVPDISSVEKEEAIAESMAHDLGADRTALRAELDELSKEYANILGDYGADHQAWVNIKTTFVGQSKIFAGIRQSITKENDVKKLERARDWMKAALDALKEKQA